ncbi:MAG: hypothetical protein WC551_01290 [Patescibacteria group bacterium]
MLESKQGRVMMVDEQGGCRFYRRYSGPLRAGQTVIRIEVIQTADSLDDEQVALLGKQIEAFLSTLKDGAKTAIPDEVLVERLLSQTTEHAFNRLLKVRDAYAFWMIQAWTAEARYLLERLPAMHAKRQDVASVLKRIESWSNALIFDQDPEPDQGQGMDWGHMALNARRQADLVRRTSVDQDSPKSLHGRGEPRQLFAKLRRLAKTNKRLYLVGFEEDVDLQASCHQAVGPVIEWLACQPNDLYQAAVRLRLKKNPSIAGVLLMPDVDKDLAQDLAEFCRVSGLSCVMVERPDGESLRKALCLLEDDANISLTE